MSSRLLLLSTLLLASCETAEPEKTATAPDSRWTLPPGVSARNQRENDRLQKLEERRERLEALEEELEETEMVMHKLHSELSDSGLPWCTTGLENPDVEYARLESAISTETDPVKLAELKSNQREFLAAIDRMIQLTEGMEPVIAELKKAEFRRVELETQIRQLKNSR